MSNPTSNFGWQMPTATDLVTDLPADFEVFGQAVDTDFVDLLGGTTGQVLSKTSATDLDFTWTTPTDQTPLTTKGDLFTFTTVDARLGVGANATVLTADSTQATGMKWATPTPGGGKVLQVVQGSTTTTVQSNTSTFVDTTLSATITPTLNTSKVLVMVAHTDNYRSSGNFLEMNLLRGATVIMNAARENMRASVGTTLYAALSFNYLDSPATTSATTYKTQFASEANTATVWVQQGTVAVSTILLLEIGA